MFFLPSKFKHRTVRFLNFRNYSTFNDICVKFQKFQFYKKSQKNEIFQPLVLSHTPFIHRSSIKPWDVVESVIDSRFEKKGSNDRMDHPLLAMYGHSRSGKTRMLTEIGKHFNEKNYIVIPVNYNGKTPVTPGEKKASDEIELTSFMALRLISACCEIPKECLNALFADGMKITIHEAIKMIHEHYKQDDDTRVLILVDEILKLTFERSDKDVIIVGFISELCAILHQTYPFVTFVISSLAESPINKVTTDSGRPIEHIDLSPFDISTSKQFVKEIYKKVENKRDLSKAIDFCVIACGGVAGALTHLNFVLDSCLVESKLTMEPYDLCKHCEIEMVKYFTNIYQTFFKAITKDTSLIMCILFLNDIALTEELYDKYQRITPIQRKDGILTLPLYVLWTLSRDKQFENEKWSEPIIRLLEYDKDSFKTTGMGLEHFIMAYHYLLFLTYEMKIVKVPQTIVEFYKIPRHSSYLRRLSSKTNDEKQKAVLHELIEYNEDVCNEKENPLGTREVRFPTTFKHETPKTFPKDYTRTQSYMKGESFVHPTNKNNPVCEGGFGLLSSDNQIMVHVFLQCKQYKDAHVLKPIKSEYLDNFCYDSAEKKEKWYIIYFMNIETDTNLSKKREMQQQQCELSNTNSLFLFKENMEYWVVPTFQNLITFLKTLDTKS